MAKKAATEPRKEVPPPKKGASFFFEGYFYEVAECVVEDNRMRAERPGLTATKAKLNAELAKAIEGKEDDQDHFDKMTEKFGYVPPAEGEEGYTRYKTVGARCDELQNLAGKALIKEAQKEAAQYMSIMPRASDDEEAEDFRDAYRDRVMSSLAEVTKLLENKSSVYFLPGRLLVPPLERPVIAEIPPQE